MSNPPESKKTPEELLEGIRVAREAAMKKAQEQSPAPAPASAPDTVVSVPKATDQDVVAAATAAGISQKDLERAVADVLNKRKREVIEDLTPKEPDYSKLSEHDIYSQDIYIPVIDHELPDYMNVALKDSEYVAVWSNKDQRRLGALLAEGYELLKREHMPMHYTPPLKFTSEGLYEYQDVVALRVHKRIRFAKLRRILEVSKNQLKPVKAKVNAKAKLMEEVIANDPSLDLAFASGKFGFYDTEDK